MSASKSRVPPLLCGWSSLALLLMSAVVLAWISGEGAWASFFDSPKSPLLPVAGPPSAGLLPVSSRPIHKALLVGGLVLTGALAIPFLARWMVAPVGESACETGGEVGDGAS